jgi:DNA-directed RNA polymerase specialized sigma24 family protein
LTEQEYAQLDADAERIAQEQERKRKKRGRVRMLLWSWGQTMDLINQKREEMDALLLWAEDAADTLAAQRLTGMPGGGETADSVSHAVEALDRRRQMYADAAADAQRRMEDMLRRKHAMDDLIERLPMTQQRILSLRYVDGHKWDFIALKMNYDERSVRRHENAAVSTLMKGIEFEPED